MYKHDAVLIRIQENLESLEVKLNFPIWPLLNINVHLTGINILNLIPYWSNCVRWQMIEISPCCIYTLHMTPIFEWVIKPSAHGLLIICEIRCHSWWMDRCAVGTLQLSRYWWREKAWGDWNNQSYKTTSCITRVSLIDIWWNWLTQKETEEMFILLQKHKHGVRDSVHCCDRLNLVLNIPGLAGGLTDWRLHAGIKDFLKSDY